MSFLDSNILFVDRNRRFEALIEIPSPTCQCVKLFLHLMQRFQSCCLSVRSKHVASKPNGRIKNRFRTFEEEEKCEANAIQKSTGNIKTSGRLETWQPAQQSFPFPLSGLLAGESESQGEVAQTHGARAKRGTGGRGWGGKEKPAAEPLHFTKRRSSTNGRQLGIAIGQSRVNQNDRCRQLVNRFNGMIRSDQLQPQSKINLLCRKLLAVSLGVGKTSGCLLNGKDVLAVLPAGFGERAMFQLFVRVKRYTCMSKDSALVICLLRGLMEEQIAEARSMGLTTNSLPEASLGDAGAGKFQLLFSSVFSCAVSVSLEFSVIFLLSKYTDCPNCRYSLRRDCKISSRSMEMPVFFKTC